jgi:hypothetical protein
MCVPRSPQCERRQARDRARGRFAACAALFVLAPGALTAPGACRGQTPPDCKIAFIADQGLEPESQAVLSLIQSEGAQAMVISGDFDYTDDPQAWEAQIDLFLGADFPYFASIGNHDTARFFGPGGYQEVLAGRMNLLGIPWSGDLGIQSSFVYLGIHFVLTGPDVQGTGHDAYIRDTFAASASPWRISSWHKNMRLMQTEHKADETGWGVYEEARRAGAIIVTGHAHTYSRTHLLSSMQSQVVASTSETLAVRRDDPSSSADEGASIAIVSGLGGRSIRDQHVSGDWFASVYTSTQNATFGALFGIFNYQGDPTLARFYFKNIAGVVVDSFYVRSPIASEVSGTGRGGASPGTVSLRFAAGNPMRRRLAVLYHLPRPTRVSLLVADVRGRVIHEAYRRHPHADGLHSWEWDTRGQVASGTYFVHLVTPGDARTARTVLLR